MSAAVKETEKKLPATPWGCLPPRLHTLFIAGSQRTGGWLADALAADRATEVVLHEVIGMSAGLTRLRDEAFDAVLISHEASGLDALDLVDAIRAGGGEDQSIIVLGAQSEQEMAALCYEAGADAYVCVNTATTRALIWTVARAMEYRRLIMENRRLQRAQHHRLQQEHDEATRLLQQQRTMVADLERLRWCTHRPGLTLDPGAGPSARGCADFPGPLVRHYRELLRAYVIMGSGNLANEMNRLAELLASAGLTAIEAMMLHLHVLEEMIQGLGNRSARHVMNRADMLILEVMINLAEGYRKRFLNRLHPPRQLLLPGFDDPCPNLFSR